MKRQKFFAAFGVAVVAVIACLPAETADAAYRFSDFRGRPPVHVYRSGQLAPTGLSPAEIKKAYHLPSSGGKGTIAIIDAYDDPAIESDLAVFDRQYGIPACTTKNGCLIKHKMASSIVRDAGWAMEIALDVEWAHAIAPSAKILLVEARTPSGANLLDAIDYAASRRDVVAVSMSWGGDEFPDEISYDTHFTSRANPKMVFFASSGDNGAGASWPAASPNVIGVGGTTLALSSAGSFVSEKAWSGSGGGVSAYEEEPGYQRTYRIPEATGMRAIPDVSYDADPASGFPVYLTAGTGTRARGSWNTVGGTSAGAPQWAAIHALGGTATPAKLYADKASSRSLAYFRDITSGTNGACAYYCTARKRYDYVTGLGSPLTARF